MNAYVQRTQERQQSRAVANAFDRRGRGSTACCQQPHQLSAAQERANRGPQARHVAQLRQVLNSGPRSQAPLQRRENRTGLPNRLKTGIEGLSDLSLDDVKVEYNSTKPARFQAHAITQGKEIHVGPGQEHHLPHEAWHVVQQKQGRVRATTQMHGAAINTDSALEREADVMGVRASTAAAGSTAQHRHLVNNSPRVESLASYQRSINSSPAVVAQAKFQNILNNRQGVSPVAQLKSGASISGAVVQRTNGDSNEPSWKTKLKEKLPWLMLGGYLAFNRAALNESADPLKKFGKDQAITGAFEHSQIPLKSYRLWQNLKKIRGGGPAAYLAMAPAAVGAAWFLSQAYKKYNQKEEE